MAGSGIVINIEPSACKLEVIGTAKNCAMALITSNIRQPFDGIANDVIGLFDCCQGAVGLGFSVACNAKQT